MSDVTRLLDDTAAGDRQAAADLLPLVYDELRTLAAVRMPEAADALVAFYTATNKPDEIEKWRAERAKYPNELAPPPRVVK